MFLTTRAPLNKGQFKRFLSTKKSNYLAFPGSLSSAPLSNLLTTAPPALTPVWQEHEADMSEEATKAYDKFWKHFVVTAAELHKIPAADHPLFQALALKLGQVDLRLCCEINKGGYYQNATHFHQRRAKIGAKVS